MDEYTEMLEQYVLGQLDPELAAALEAHMRVCDDCRERVEAEEAYVRAFRTASERIAGDY